MTGTTTDRNDPGLQQIEPSGMQSVYLVLSDEERAKGFVRPLFTKYTHLKCGTETMMGLAIAETYARNPRFYGGTFCCHCGHHYSLIINFEWQFTWPDGSPVGSVETEAKEFLQSKQYCQQEQKFKNAIQPLKQFGTEDLVRNEVAKIIKEVDDSPPVTRRGLVKRSHRWDEKFNAEFCMSTDNGTGPEFLFQDNHDGTISIATKDRVKEFIRKVLNGEV